MVYRKNGFGPGIFAWIILVSCRYVYDHERVKKYYSNYSLEVCHCWFSLCFHSLYTFSSSTAMLIYRHPCPDTRPVRHSRPSVCWRIQSHHHRGNQLATWRRGVSHGRARCRHSHVPQRRGAQDHGRLVWRPVYGSVGWVMPVGLCLNSQHCPQCWAARLPRFFLLWKNVLFEVILFVHKQCCNSVDVVFHFLAVG